MHENVLQPIGHREPLSQQHQHYGNSFFMDDLFHRKTSAVVQPMQAHIKTPDKENFEKKDSFFSPVLPGTGNLTHNITRMLFESTPAGKQTTNEAVRSGYQPYDLSGHYNKGLDHLSQNTECNKRKAEEDLVDVEGDAQDHLRTSDLPNTTDSSISTQGSSSPSSSAGSLESPNSAATSPGSGSEPTTSPDVKEPPKKKARTNYTPDQIQTLLKIFHENPYPDSEMMETIAGDLGVPENKIKIWFQNKRARWRRRNNDSMNNYMQPFMPMSHVMSPMATYGFMPPGHVTPVTAMNPMMRTSPPHGFPGYFNMPWMQGPGSPNGNQALNANAARYQQTPQHAPMTSQQISPPAFPVSSAASQFPTRTSPLQVMTSQNGRQLQYPQFLYPSSYPQAHQ